MIFTTLSPNTQKDDLLLSLKILLNPFTWNNPKYINKFVDSFNQKLGLKNSFPVDSARSGLYIFLESLGLKKTDEVLLQAYTCVALINPILWSGLKPVYVDCNKDDFNINIENLKQKITKNSKVLIIQHTFGNPAELNELLKIAKENNLIVIEDCAHSLGARYNNEYTGTFGDASIFSFGRDKVISCTTGGILSVNNPKFLHSIKSEFDKLSYPSKKWSFQQIIHPIILSASKPTYNFFKLGRIILAISLKLNLISKPIYKSEKSGNKPIREITKLSGAVSRLALHQFNKLDKYNDHRKKISNIYNKLVENPTVEKPVPKKHLNSIFTRYTILVENPSKIYAKFINKNIQLGTWFDSVIIPKDTILDKINYKNGSCPNAEYLTKKSLNLPNGIQVSKEDASRISNLINELR